MFSSNMSEKAFRFTIDSLLRSSQGPGEISRCLTDGSTQDHVVTGVPKSQPSFTNYTDQSLSGSSRSSACTNDSEQSVSDVSTSSDFTHTASTGNAPDEEKRKQIPKKSKKSFTEFQTSRLEERYRTDRYLSTDQRVDLAEQLGLTSQQVTRWFQNRRMKEKRQLIQMRTPKNRLCPRLEVGGHVTTQLPAPGMFLPPAPVHHLQFGPTYIPFIRNAPFSVNPVQVSQPPFPRNCCHGTFLCPCSCSL